MIKGCSKRVVVLKNPKSDIFEEAYFIVREKKVPDSKGTMIDEANRIIVENTLGARPLVKKDKSRSGTLLFLMGMVTSLTLAIIYALII